MAGYDGVRQLAHRLLHRLRIEADLRIVGDQLQGNPTDERPEEGVVRTGEGRSPEAGARQHEHQPFEGVRHGHDGFEVTDGERGQRGMDVHRATERVRQRAQPVVPRLIGGIGKIAESAAEHEIVDPAEHGISAPDVPVDRGRIRVESLRQRPHREPAETDVVEQLEGSPEHVVGGQCLLGHPVIVAATLGVRRAPARGPTRRASIAPPYVNRLMPVVRQVE